MADDQVQVEEAATEAEQSAEVAVEAAAKAEEAVAEVKEVAAAAEAKADKEVKAESKSEKVVSKSLSEIIEKIEKLTVLELADLVHALEDKFGVSASAPVAMAASGAPAGAATGEPQEEKTTFNVILTSAGANKISAIKAVREIVPTLGLKEAKDLVEAAPKPVLESVNKATAEEAKAKLTAAGATVELQ